MGNNKGAFGSRGEEQRAETWFNNYDSSRKVKVYADANDKIRIKNEMFKNISAEINSVRTLRLNVLRIAAILVLISGVGLLTYFYKSANQSMQQDITWNIIEADSQNSRSVLLADSSTVVLKPGAKLSIPSNFNRSGRFANLISGEAFFEVKRNPEKPFVVQSGKLSVKVLGTAFTVKDNKTAKSKQVAVAHGLVQVSEGGTVLSRLTKGKRLTYNIVSHHYTVDAVEPSRVGIWLREQVELDQVSFAELAQTFEGLYGKKLYASENEISQSHFTLTIYQKLSASATLKIIAKTHGLNFYEKDEKIILTRKK